MSEYWINQIAEATMPKEEIKSSTLSLEVDAELTQENLAKIESLLKHNGFSVKASVKAPEIQEKVGDSIQVVESFKKPLLAIVRTAGVTYKLDHLNISAGLIGKVAEVRSNNITADFDAHIEVEAKDTFDNPVVIDYHLDSLELKPGQYKKI